MLAIGSTFEVGGLDIGEKRMSSAADERRVLLTTVVVIVPRMSNSTAAPLVLGIDQRAATHADGRGRVSLQLVFRSLARQQGR